MLRSFREYLTQSMIFFDLCNTLKFVCGTHVHPCVRKRVCDAVSVFVSFLLTSCLLTSFTNDPSVKFTNGVGKILTCFTNRAQIYWRCVSKKLRSQRVPNAPLRLELIEFLALRVFEWCNSQIFLWSGNKFGFTLELLTWFTNILTR